MPTTPPPTLEPTTYRLPQPGDGDRYFGFSRSFYYNGEAKGWWRLIRIRDEGKNRGVTLVPYKDVLRFVQSQMKAQS